MSSFGLTEKDMELSHIYLALSPPFKSTDHCPWARVATNKRDKTIFRITPKFFTIFIFSVFLTISMCVLDQEIWPTEIPGHFLGCIFKLRTKGWTWDKQLFSMDIYRAVGRSEYLKGAISYTRIFNGSDFASDTTKIGGEGEQIPNLPRWLHRPCITILGKMWYASTTGKNLSTSLKTKNKKNICHQ